MLIYMNMNIFCTVISVQGKNKISKIAHIVSKVNIEAKFPTLTFSFKLLYGT